MTRELAGGRNLFSARFYYVLIRVNRFSTGLNREVFPKWRFESNVKGIINLGVNGWAQMNVDGAC